MTVTHDPCDLSDRGWDPSESFEESANDDNSIVELECDFVDHMDRALFCRVGWRPLDHEAEWVEIWDGDARVNVDIDTRDAIVRKAVDQ